MNLDISIKNIVQNFDLNKNISSIEGELAESEIDSIMLQLKPNDFNSLFSYGANISKQIDILSNKSINFFKNDNMKSTTELTEKLSSFISKLEPKDFINENKGSFFNIFKKDTKLPLDELYKKYTPILYEADRVIVLVKSFQAQLKNSNEYLYEMFQKSLAYYAQIRKYSRALDKFKNDKSVLINLDDRYKDMLDKKYHNLKMVENIILQQTVAIKNMISNNYAICENMNSFYIATIPLLKQCVSNSFTLKKQSLKSKSDELIKKQIQEVLDINPALGEKLKENLIKSDVLEKDTLLKTMEILKNGIAKTEELNDKREKDLEKESNKLIELKEVIELNI